MKRLILAASIAALPLAALAVPAHAQSVQTAPVVSPGATVLTVQAEGRTTRVPDLAVFSAGVTSEGKTASEALAANARAMNATLSALKASGVAARDMQTSNLSVSPVYGQQKRLPDGSTEGDPVIVGYRATNQVQVKQRDLARYGQVIDTLVKAGANEVNGPSFQLDKPDVAQDEARVDAVSKARARAELYARAAGLKVVRILTISETGGWSPQPPMLYARADKMMMSAAPSPVAAGELDVSASVTITFELAPQ
ncbi:MULTISPECIES: SIMPL domain-containing protein [unclassified Sphingomonas]|uniref:SIMPL domain-containing protein n=1 Tax=Novosphingobium rhizosphaerae TaxID=1551649 RepID=UPI0015CC140F